MIAASIQEGFGLPLICSDIPVFREVTQGNADFFIVKDADSLSESLMNDFLISKCMSEGGWVL